MASTLHLLPLKLLFCTIMEIEDTKLTTLLLFSFFFILHAVLRYIDLSNSWLAFYASVLHVAGILIACGALVLAARATMLTWITVIVILAFSGKRRRVLAGQGREITAEMAMYLVRVVFRGKAVPAVALATAVIVSFY